MNRESDKDIVIYSLKLNDKGLCTEFTDNTEDPARVWTYTYDADGFQLTASRDGEVKTQYAIQNKNIFTWSRDGSRYKEHKYKSNYCLYNNQGCKCCNTLLGSGCSI